MEINNLENKLNKIYDLMIGGDHYEDLKEDHPKLKAIFLSEADKLFNVPYSMSGHQLRYQYYFHGNLFADIDLKDCPNFTDRENFINWFNQQLSICFKNLKSFT
ncbi:hypothetical protein [Acinetobacter oleivorans]|uniref:hypothetical protein n=1 Tax=Acinetobacter oleivorans TaxID=1148157 RepID=UPI001230E5AD|nr:hypothetical protein [Acinetobacter oleivorans]